MLSIVLTGGPSSGKTTVINSIQEYFRQMGYNVIVIPEAATLAINSGIKPFGENALDGITYQRIILKRQLVAEETAKMAAEKMGNNTIIIYDRGTLDGYAYVTDDEWDYVLASLGVDRRELLCNYDAVLYLEGSKSFFTKENNAARYEADAEDALEKGRRVLKSYLTHDNLMVVQPREHVEDKQHEVVSIIQNMLGCPVQLRDQRKFLVDSIDVKALEDYANRVVITQDYLDIDDSFEYRIRKVEQNGNYTYHYNVQKPVEGGLREVVKESSISKEDYERFLKAKSPDRETCVKERYSFVYANQYFKLDVFPSGLMILEVNVTKQNPDITLPPFISVLEDVTNDPNYRNINMTRGSKYYGKRKINSSRGN